MFYEYHQGLKRIEIDTWDGSTLLFGIVTSQEMNQLHERLHFDIATMQEYEHESKRMHHKMDSYYGYNFGLLQHITKGSHGFSKIRVGVYVNAQVILVICDDEMFCQTIFQAVYKINQKTFCKEHVLSALLHCIIVEHTDMIEQMETRLATMDEQVLENHMKDFNTQIRSFRNEILFLTHYYEQFMDVCEELLQDENGFFQTEELHHLRIMSDRIQRLDSNVRLLKDYMVQVQNSYQAQVDMNLNHIMYFFTVITTIFLPLTLIVGWYGMNFKNMPELNWRFGYPLVILLSIITVVLCILFFKKNKLLK